MRHDDDAFATMLLMSQLSAGKDELVRPLTTSEYFDLRRAVRKAGLSGPGALIGMDVGTVKKRLGLSEEQGYRVCVLLNRVMPLSYALERFSDGGIDVVTCDEPAYPARLRARLGEKTPPMLYAVGDTARAGDLTAAVLCSSVAIRPALECSLALTARLLKAGVTLVTGGEVGFGRLIEREALNGNGKVITFLAESLSERIYQPGLSEMIATSRALAMSIVHPEAKYTTAHALERNKCLYALSDAAFVVACEKERGATWDGAVSALRNGYTERLYVWENRDLSGNMALIERGATPFSSPNELALEKMVAAWRQPAFEQLTMF